MGKSVENTMKGGALILLAILGLVTPLLATSNEDPETVEIERMNEGLDFDEYEDSDDRLDEDPDEDFDELDGKNVSDVLEEFQTSCPERMETNEDENARKQKYVSWTNQNGRKEILDR